MLVTDDNQVVVAVCTPLMQIVHKLVKHSGEVVFCDASGNMDRNQCRVFVFLTHTCVGGLPLGILIVTSESQRTVTAALNLYMEMMDDDAFFGRGRNGPAIFLTDDSASDRAALREVFPHSTLLLCVFHVLQAFWCYLLDSKSGVPREERPVIFALYKDMVYASSVEALQVAFDKAMSTEVCTRHRKVTGYIAKSLATFRQC